MLKDFKKTQNNHKHNTTQLKQRYKAFTKQLKINHPRSERIINQSGSIIYHIA